MFLSVYRNIAKRTSDRIARQTAAFGGGSKMSDTSMKKTISVTARPALSINILP